MQETVIVLRFLIIPIRREKRVMRRMMRRRRRLS
jgi:hypothetical protein